MDQRTTPKLFSYTFTERDVETGQRTGRRMELLATELATAMEALLAVARLADDRAEYASQARDGVILAVYPHGRDGGLLWSMESQ
jgi:hypothetical protein